MKDVNVTGLISLKISYAVRTLNKLEVPALPWPPDWWTPPRPPRRRWGWRYYSPRSWRACWAHSDWRDDWPLTEYVWGARLNAREAVCECLDVLLSCSEEPPVTLRRVCVCTQKPPPSSLSLSHSVQWHHCLSLWMLACTCTQLSCFIIHTLSLFPPILPPVAGSKNYFMWLECEIQ